MFFPPSMKSYLLQWARYFFKEDLCACGRSCLRLGRWISQISGKYPRRISRMFARSHAWHVAMESVGSSADRREREFARRVTALPCLWSRQQSAANRQKPEHTHLNSASITNGKVCWSRTFHRCGFVYSGCSFARAERATGKFLSSPISEEDHSNPPTAQEAESLKTN